MLFDFMKNEDSRLKGYNQLYTHCVDCERTARTHPFNISTRARTAVESFLDAVLDINGVQVPTDYDQKQAAGLSTIVDKMQYCFANGYLDTSVSYSMNLVRSTGNDAVHSPLEKSVKKLLTTIEKVETDIVYSKNAEAEAAKVFKSLYLLVYGYAMGKKISRIAPNERRNAYVRKSDNVRVAEIKGYQTYDLLPIGDYEVIKPMFSFHGQPPKIKSYKCRKIEHYEGREECRYAIIRRFEKDSDGDVTQFRDLMAMDTIKKYNSRISQMPIWSEEIPTAVDCRVRFLCYLTEENTFMLNQRDEYEKFLRDYSSRFPDGVLTLKLGIIEQITEILYSLIDITDSVSIHHRNLHPSCIFITPTPKGCSVRIGNFEYSKVVDTSVASPSPLTVGPNAFALKTARDPYAPNEIKLGAFGKDSKPDWEQVDVFAVAKIALYVLFGNASDENLAQNLEAIRENMSPEFHKIITSVIKNEYKARPTLGELLKVIRREIVLAERV